ncbi:hypothetical protein MUY21_14190 [Aliiroseovarius sp. S2029]|uniref:hypothetical protein n=1 Tax=Aliiroseovarius sp. S2029 TaxID=2936988 RepID=UPI0020C03E65|nr:hypothetical protein [Aliiroseovarius sp. S2029]MCK8485192.1 hypothetical protein [Aliiroseovarius sp. S2029]
MTYRITVTATYPRDADAVFAEACQFAELVQAMRGIATYDGLPAGAAQQGKTYVVDVTLFGLIRNPGHTMFVERLDHQARLIQSREHNASVRRWDHELSVQPDGAGAVWTDTVEIDAPRAAWFTAQFARFVYTRRHKKRKATTLVSRIERV